MCRPARKLMQSHSLVFLVSVVLMNGCAVTGDTYYPVKEVAPRHSTLGFSVCPPPGKGWYEKHKDDSLVYLKQLSPASYSISAKATEIHVEDEFKLQQEFHQYVKKHKEYRKLPEQYRNVQFRYSNMNGLSPFCVKYQNTYEDHTTAQEDGVTYDLVKRSGIICMHPESPRDGIDMYYLERSAATSSKKQSFEHEGERFLSSLQFYPITR